MPIHSLYRIMGKSYQFTGINFGHFGHLGQVVQIIFIQSGSKLRLIKYFRS